MTNYPRVQSRAVAVRVEEKLPTPVNDWQDVIKAIATVAEISKLHSCAKLTGPAFAYGDGTFCDVESLLWFYCRQHKVKWLAGWEN
jgi:hypothetical protein